MGLEGHAPSCPTIRDINGAFALACNSKLAISDR